jgi:hypothetical protein
MYSLKFAPHQFIDFAIILHVFIGIETVEHLVETGGSRIAAVNGRILHFNVDRARVVEDIIAHVAGARGLVAFTVSSGELGRTVMLAHGSLESKARRLRDRV